MFTNYFLFQELLSKGRKRRTTLVIAAVVVLALLVAGVLYFLKPEASPMRASYVSDLKPIALESFLKGEYSPRRFNGTWVSGQYSTTNYAITIIIRCPCTIKIPPIN